MGEKVFYGATKLHIGERDVNPEPHELVALDCEISSQEPLVSVDSAEECGDKTGITQWEKGSIVLSLTISSEDNPLGKWYCSMVRQFCREKKALFYALTHGFTLRIACRDDNDNDGYFDLTLPSQLRQVMRITKFIPQYRIYDRYGSRYVIRKGKVVRIPTAPIPLKVLKEHTKKLKSYKV